jgi:hypothetical protein
MTTKLKKVLKELFLITGAESIEEVAAKGGYKAIVVEKKWLSVTHQQLEKDLIKRGFVLITRYHDGEYENYGDYNAPCNVWRDAYQTWTISW